MTLDTLHRFSRLITEAEADTPPPTLPRPHRRVNIWAVLWFLLALAGWGLFFYARVVIIGV